MRLSSLFPRACSSFVVAAGLFAYARPARADEIVTRHPDTCERVTIKCFEVLPETWTEVEYREGPRGPTKKLPMTLVLEINRTSGGNAKSALEAAVQELDRGNLTEARTALRELSGGGFGVVDSQRVFTSFMPRGAGGARGRRPAWTAEYAHFFYAKSLVLEGAKTGNDKLLEEALMCLDDVALPAAPDVQPRDRETSGGFLARFKGGNSRWYPEAMLLKAKALAGLKRYEEAQKAYDELFNEAVGLGLSARWVYEAKTGPGEMAEAQGDQSKAGQIYEQAPTTLETLVAQAPNRCLRLETGHYYNLVRARAADLLLRKAEATGGAGAYVSVKSFLLASLPEALQRKFQGSPAEQREAIMVGARAPEVQAVIQTGLGQAYLAEGKLEEALLALRVVAVCHFGSRERAAQALYYLAKAADGAAKAATKPEAKAYYQRLQEGAVSQLKAEYAESPYATR